MRKLIYLFLVLVLIGTSCKTDSKKGVEKDQDKEVDSVVVKQQKPEQQSPFVPQSTDQQTANNIKNFLVNDYLKEELSFLQDNDRKFQFYQLDLNGDGNDEIFVRFMSPYFCGSGGCTFLLLDKYGEVITRFSVTRSPIFVESKKVNDWALLLVKDAGVFKELTFKDGSYPSNPSMLPKAPYDAPSGHAEVLFHDELYISKTFEF
ncbi:hypothetical protein [Lutimonas sp.]|uniref:hypothetical protein n=1 Tax=Lutimonas sp. TaxID=1872403 RepID=UPI003D9BF6AD